MVPGFGWLRPAFASLIAFGLTSSAAFPQSCPNSGQTVKADSTAYVSGIDCGSDTTITEDYTFLLEDGLRIASESGAGIYFKGTGDITIATEGPKHDVTVTGGANQHAIHVQGRDVAAQNLKLAVGNIFTTADGIRVTGLTGTADIKVHGTIRARGEAGSDADGNAGGGYGGAIMVGLVDPNSPGGQVTTIEVNEIISTQTRGDVGEVAGVLVDAPGDIKVTSKGSISTTGDEVKGVLVLLGTIQGDDPGSVDISVHNLLTTGDNAPAIEVVRYAGPTKDKPVAVDVTVTGDLATSGREAHGIAAEGRNTAVNINVDEGASVTVPEAMAKTIYVGDRSGNDSRPIASVKINNRGTITGDIFAEACSPPILTNRGTLNSGGKIELIGSANPDCGSVAGAAGRLENLGTVSPGGGGNIAVTELTGDYTQMAGGTLELDVDWSKKSSDLLVVEGMAGLAGSVSLRLHSDPTDLPLAGTDEAKANKTLVMTASRGIIGEDTLSIPETLIYKNSLFKDSSGKRLYLSSHLDLRPGGINDNQQDVLDKLQPSRDHGDKIRDAFRGTLGHTSIDDLRVQLDGLGNEIAAATIHTGISSAQRSAREVPSCLPEFGRGRIAGVCFGANGTWFEGSNLENADQLGFRSSGSRFTEAAGWVFDDLDGGVGISIGIGNTAVSMDPHAWSAGETFSGGLKWTGSAGPVAYAVAATAGWASFDIVRALAQTDCISSGKLSLKNYSLHGELGYPLHFNSLKITPAVGLDATHFRSKPYTESGAEGLSLQVDGVSGTAMDARLGLTVEGWGAQTRSFALTPIFNLAWIRSDKGEISVDSKFAGGGDSMRSTMTFPKSNVRAEIGARFVTSSGRLSGRAGLVYSRGVNKQSHSASASASVTYLF